MHSFLLAWIASQFQRGRPKNPFLLPGRSVDITVFAGYPAGALSSRNLSVANSEKLLFHTSSLLVAVRLRPAFLQHCLKLQAVDLNGYGAAILHGVSCHRWTGHPDCRRLYISCTRLFYHIYFLYSIFKTRG